MSPARPTPGEVADGIESYLAQHPRAADTAAGIQRWWLAPRFGEVPVDLVQEALHELERRGVVSRHELAGQVVYRRFRKGRGG
ncbi:hypothetical protein H8N03_10735 [Ramlibacter sp. USB13]|uniref:Uncharacterized protein n=1 Tax=Ramlibacter cellulosilyticus TaxID=2764187 RepID=A0A923MR71_9BURK|nr:hypothetical protein [Ramlibacter cellulosilyticus]MBC5783421.1 hypothetical protein [Ramlibacter cellulosilyticus]